MKILITEFFFNFQFFKNLFIVVVVVVVVVIDCWSFGDLTYILCALSSVSSPSETESLGRKMRRRKMLAACFLLSLPGTMLQFGNILPYLDSYYQVHRPDADIDPLWVVSAFNIFRIFGVIASSVAETRIGLVGTLSLGGAVVCISFLLSYWTVVEPLALFITFGIFYGLGAGAMSPVISKVSLQHVDSVSSWTNSLIAAGLPAGGILYMIIAYLVVNPFNARADRDVDHKTLFSDDDLISNVPYYFLAIACITVVPVAVGIGLIYLNSTETTRKKNCDGEISDMEEMVLYAAKEEQARVKKSKKTTGQYGAVKHNNGQPSQNDDKTNSTGADATEKTFMVQKGREYWLDYTTPSESATNEGFTANEDKPEHSSETGTQDGDSHKIGNEEQVTSVLLTETDTSLQCDLEPKEVVKTKHFWSLWLCTLLLTHTQYIHENLYKLYGATEISNDALLLVTGLLGMLAIAVARPLSWTAFNRWEPKIVLASISAVTAVLMTLMFVFHNYFPPLYIVTTILEFAAVSTVYLLHTEIPSRLFGPTHVTSNALMISTATVVVSILDPIIAHQAVRTDSWGGLITSGSFSAAFALFGFVLLLPNMRKPQ